jgi:hypothetical protein
MLAMSLDTRGMPPLVRISPLAVVTPNPTRLPLMSPSRTPGSPRKSMPPYETDVVPTNRPSTGPWKTERRRVLISGPVPAYGPAP